MPDQLTMFPAPPPPDHQARADQRGRCQVIIEGGTTLIPRSQCPTCQLFILAVEYPIIVERHLTDVGRAAFAEWQQQETTYEPRNRSRQR